MTRYIVLWIPTMSKRNLKVHVHELPESHLQDIPNTNGVRILASIDDNFNISTASLMARRESASVGQDSL